MEEESVAEHPCPPDGDAVEYGFSNRGYNQAKEESLWELSKTMVGVESKPDLIDQSGAKQLRMGLVWAGRHSFSLAKEDTKTKSVRLVPSKLR